MSTIIVLVVVVGGWGWGWGRTSYDNTNGTTSACDLREPDDNYGDLSRVMSSYSYVSPLNHKTPTPIQLLHP